MRQQIYLIGRLGQDPETRGESMVSFTIATSNSYKNKEGEKVTETEWWNLTAYGKTGEFVSKYLKKGDLVCVDCHRRTIKKDEKTFYNYIVEKVIGLSSGQKERTEKPETQPQQADISDIDNQDDLPF